MALKKEHKGEITAFLAMIFVLMIALTGALVESAAIRIAKSRRRADTRLALESFFAEYDRQMLERYDLFVRADGDEAMLKSRLGYYGASGMTNSLEKAEYLTDQGGAVFYREAVRSMKHLLGLKDFSLGADYDFGSGMDPEAEEERVNGELDDLLSKGDIKLPEENNPLTSMKALKNTNLLSILVADSSRLSEQAMETDNLPSKRELRQGNYGTIPETGVSDKAFFTAYLTSHFKSAADTWETADQSSDGSGKEEGSISGMADEAGDGTLLYELEYLLGGLGEDKANLEKVCRKIISVRMTVNYVYLLTDAAKKAEAGALALALCALIAFPEAAKPAQHAILLAWAYGESLVDARNLLNRKKVPLVKSPDTWQLQLSNLAKLGTDNELVDAKNPEQGFSYDDYLKGLLLMEDKENLCMRSLDLIESKLNISTDLCMTAAKVRSIGKLTRGIKDTFLTSYQYR